MFKRLIFLFLFMALFQNIAIASHLMGGEITWVCNGSGQYVFTMKLYRDCNGATASPNLSINVFNHPTVSTIAINLLSSKDISPKCNGAGPTISCAAAESQPGWPNNPMPIMGAVMEYVYQSAPINLPGVPPAAGWIFAYKDCCRNNSLSNIQTPSAFGMTVRSVMYGYNGQNASPCFDSSPNFLESPSTVICMGYPFTYNHNAFDPDLDSLSYSWAQPLDDFISTTTFNPPVDPGVVPFSTGYSYTSPLPGAAQNTANVPATVNPQTGEISFTSFTQGNFVTVVKVQAWKCGQLVAEIYREIQVVLLPCASNLPPTVTYTTYQDTVTAGDVVNFTLNATDNGLLADGITPQTISITASGNQFGSNFTNAAGGCSNPPCATLNATPPISSSPNASTIFNWQTSCNHISTESNCNAASNTYNFVFKVQDDFCPAPAENITTVSITVLALPVIQSPQPRCVAVQPNGDITLTWSTPADPNGGFNSYHIYTSNALAGPYTLLDSVFTYTQTSYTHVGANGNTASRFYYIQSRSGCNVYSPALDTVRSILLNVINPANGTATLTWNAIATPSLNSSTGVYTIFQEFPTGVWTQTGSTTNLNFLDTIFVCNATINYRVEIQDTTGCTSVSSIAGGLFQNIIVPSIPVFDTLSVDDANNAIMNWNVNPSPDVEAYVVYQFNGTAWIPIDTVYGINNTSYTYTGSNADLSSEEYRLAAYDTCGNISPLGGILSTIFLNASPDICTRSAVLNWTAYSSSLGAGLSGYKIYQSTTSLIGPYNLLATVSATTLTYTAASLAPSTTYYFKVEAFDATQTRTVSSNRISFYSATPIPPAFIYLRKASVINDSKVQLTCHIDVSAVGLGYKIFRSVDNVNFTQIGTAPSSPTSPIVYNDPTALIDSKSYYYKLVNIDSCGYDGIETNIGKTILTRALSDSQTMTNTVYWTDYETWQGNVLSYNIYRGIDGVLDPTPIANVPFTGSNANSYVDDVSMFLDGQGVFNYYVQALEGMGNTYGFTDSAFSNVADAYQDPIFFVPNAFKPSGVNSVFIPVSTFFDLTDYEFMVFNRWGLKVFSTTNVNEGWDGTNGGVKKELGVYVYLLRYKNSKGEYFEHKGTVTLIR